MSASPSGRSRRVSSATSAPCCIGSSPVKIEACEGAVQEEVE